MDLQELTQTAMAHESDIRICNAVALRLEPQPIRDWSQADAVLSTALHFTCIRVRSSCVSRTLKAGGCVASMTGIV